MKSTALVVRSWNGQAIQRRRADGFVNATAMCKANGKHWGHYRENERCQAYARALSETIGMPMVSLIETREGRGGGTWVHPQIAVDLARWISAPFAVWMDAWFLEGASGLEGGGPLASSKARTPGAGKPDSPLSNEDLALLIDLACKRIGTTSDRVAAMAGWPVGKALSQAKESLEELQMRVRLVSKLLPLMEPIGPEQIRDWMGRRQADASAVQKQAAC